MNAFRGFDWAFCSDPPVLTLTISLRSADSTESPARGFDTVVLAGCWDDSIRCSSSAFKMLLLFEELSVGAGAEAKDNKCRKNSELTSPFTGADGENEFVSAIGKAPSRPRP
jgi:hypothetical protein